MALIFDNVNNQIVDDHGNVIAPLDLNLVVRNIGGAPSLQEGLFSAMPAAGTAGRLYISTDTDQLLRDNGTSWDVIGAAGAGSVTSVGLSAPPQFAVSGSPVTTLGTLNLAWNTQPANKILAGPSSGTDALPTFRNLTVADLPAFTVPWANITSTPTTLGGYGITNAYSRVEIDAMTFNWSRITGTPTTLAGYGITDAKHGTVTSVSGSGGTTGLTLSGGPITDIGTLTLGGTLAIANGGTGATTANAALNALLPVQTAQSGYVLTTDGSNSTWAPSTGGSGSGSPSAARFATTTSLPAYTAAGSGVGKTLTGTAATALTIDGLTPAVNDRLLVKDEVSGNAPNNGVYVVTQQGTGAAGTGEVFTIAIPATVTGGATTLAGKDIWFSSPTVDYYVWFRDISGAGAGSDPVISGRTRLGATGCTYSSSGYSQSAFGTGLRDFINTNGTGVFTATYASGLVTVTAAVAGPAKTAAQNDPARNPAFTYNVTTPGSAAHPYILTRASDFISPKSGALVPVVLGNTNADTLWMLTTDGTITIDTTSLTFAKTNAGGTIVSSFNTRSGAVTLSSSDVTSALTFTPYDAANPSGYITASGTAANVSGVVALANGGTGLSAAGTANRILGVTAAGGALEYKTVAAGTGISVGNTANTITLTNTGVTSIVAGTGITISGATGAVTINSAGSSIVGTANQITATTASGTTTLSLPSAIVIPGTIAKPVQISAAAGTTQAGATAITSSFVYVNSGTGGVRLPVPTSAGIEITIVNQLGTAINVYPSSGVTLSGAGGVDLPISLAGTSTITYVCADTTSWSPTHYPLVAGSGITITRTNGKFYTISSTSSGTGTVTSVDVSGGTTGLSYTGGPVTTSGTITLGGTLVVANGGTGASTLTGYVKGNGTSAMTASSTVPGSDVSGNITGNAANVTGTVALANGGTGATTQAGAANAVLPTQASNSGKYLTTDGTNVSWSAVAGGGTGTVTSVDASGGTTGLTFSGGPITANGTLTLAGTLAVTNGGTGLTALGSANRVLGVNAAGTGAEYKTITAGTGITVTHGANSITIASSVSAGVTSLAGTANQITASASTGAVTLSLPTTLTTPGSLAVGTVLQRSLSGKTAAGTDQSTATAITTDITNIGGATSGTGVILPAITVGSQLTVFNKTTLAVMVYPPSGASIVVDGTTLAANTGVSLAPGRCGTYTGTTSTTYTIAVDASLNVTIDGGSF